MTETAADEQDLAKALDSVANAASGVDSTTSSSSTSTATLGGGMDLPPIVPPNSPVAPAALAQISPATSDPAPLFSNPSMGPLPSHSDEPSTPSTPAVSDDSDNGSSEASTSADSSVDSTPAPSPEPSASTLSSEPVTVSGPLADIKNDALNELRPLVDKLSVSPEEKFDTYLLLIRSTDDENLIGPAHEAAKAIEDEARRAEALLDIIKEIDYLSRTKSSDN